MRKIKYIYIYFIILLILLLGYFMNISINNISIVDFVDKYLGIMAVPLFILFFMYGFIFFTKNKVKREVREVKWYFILILFFLLTFLFILFKTGVTFSNYTSFLKDEIFYRNFIDISLYKYRLGYFFTFLFYLILKIKIEFKILLIALFGLSIFIIILIIFGPIRRYLQKVYLREKEKKEEEARKRLLQEQIKIKEELDRKVTLKKKKFKENREKLREEKIDYSKLEQFRNSIKLEKTITLENQEKDKE